jgi:hypothetical protein
VKHSRENKKRTKENSEEKKKSGKCLGEKVNKGKIVMMLDTPCWAIRSSFNHAF